jgi:sigma-B regulation protein RsbU (phosphoserine phosphatase)
MTQGITKALRWPPVSPNGLAAQHHRDLVMAWQVQRKLFPRQLPQARGWQFAAWCRPARVVAGDYYDLFEIGGGRIALALGDVSGKGFGPALVMAGLRALVRLRLPPLRADLPALLEELNCYLLASTPADMFVTLWLGILAVQTGQLRYVNAGHPPPFLLAARDQEPMRMAAGGTVLGILPDARYDQGEIVVQPGNLLVVFSDGITEAGNRDGEIFREQRLIETLRAAWPAPAGFLLKRLLKSMWHFCPDGEQTDDMSIIIVQRDTGRLAQRRRTA